jgi:hypothetical protein
MSKPLL